MQNEMMVDFGKINMLFDTCNVNSMDIYESISVIRQQLQEVIESGFWVGEDANAFRQNMNVKLEQVYNLTNWINHISVELKRHADVLREEQLRRVQEMQANRDY